MTLDEAREAMDHINSTTQKINIALDIEDPIDLVNTLVGELKTRTTALEIITGGE